MVEKNSRRVWFGGLVFFTFFFLSICLFVKVLKRWFGFDSFSSQPMKLWDQSAQRLSFLGLLALPCLWGREPRCLLQSPSRMAFLFMEDFKMSLIRISPKFKPSNFSLKQIHLSMQKCNIYALNTIARGTEVQSSAIWNIIQHLLVLQTIKQCLARVQWNISSPLIDSLPPRWQSLTGNDCTLVDLG